MREGVRRGRKRLHGGWKRGCPAAMRCALLFAFVSQAWPTPTALQGTTAEATEPKAASQQSIEHTMRRLGLERATDSLPRSQPGRWRQWSESQPLPQTLQAGYASALRAYRKGDFALAAGFAQETLHTEPDYPASLLVLGMSYYQLQRYGDGAECYRRLLEVAPSALPRTRQYGHCLHSLGQYEAAAQHYTQLLASSPQNARLLRSRAIARFRMGLWQPALSDVDAALAQDPRDSQALYWRASILFDGEDTPAALLAAEAARDADPFASRTWYLLAQALWDQEDADAQAQAAQTRYEQLLAVESNVRTWQTEWLWDPTQLDRLDRIGRAHVQVGDFARAEDAYRRLLLWAQELRASELEAKAKRALEGLRKVR